MVSSKQLLLDRETGHDNLANNGEALLTLDFIRSYNEFNIKVMGNTVGRLSKVDQTQINLAYIAGFLDGDGSIMLQMHHRKANSDTFRIKTVVCFYQDCRHLNKIKWFKQILDCGYVYTRKDNICELRVEGFQKVFEVLTKLQPFIRFKRKQVDLMLKLIPKLQHKSLLKEDTVVWVKKMRSYNYVSHQRTILDDVPVTTNI